ncbi:MAG: hypothetical protein GEV03_22810 [Streptosporangiales bacterium]|nr:hypothetical protein [Streptosporangiales bacterium]
MQSLGVVIDEACAAVFAARDAQRRVTTLRVSPAIYEAIVQGKARELERGNPVMVLGLDVVNDASLSGEVAALE